MDPVYIYMCVHEDVYCASTRPLQKMAAHEPPAEFLASRGAGTFEDLRARVAKYMSCNAYGPAASGAPCTCRDGAEGSHGLFRQGSLHACLTRIGGPCGTQPDCWEQSMLQLRFMQRRSGDFGARTLQPLESRTKAMQVEELLEDAAELAGAGVYLDSRNFGVRWHIRFKLAIMDGGGHAVSSLVSSNRFHGLCVSLCRHPCTPEGLERCFQCMPRALVPAPILCRSSGALWSNYPQRSSWR